MPICSGRNSIPRMTEPYQFFNVDDVFIYEPMGTIDMLPEAKKGFTVITKRVEDHDTCEDCSLFCYCGREDNAVASNTTEHHLLKYFVPECEGFKREDQKDVIFVRY